MIHDAANKVKDIVLRDKDIKPVKKHESDHWNRYNYVLAQAGKCHEMIAESEIHIASKERCDAMGGTSNSTCGWVDCKLHWGLSDTAVTSGPAIAGAQHVERALGNSLTASFPT